jgi:hypothetical protein
LKRQGQNKPRQPDDLGYSIDVRRVHMRTECRMGDKVKDRSTALFRPPYFKQSG